jgi:hypothetical protein
MNFCKEIDYDVLSNEEQMYQKAFYSNDYFFEGKAFDIRCTEYRTDTDDASITFEILKKYDIDLADVEMKILFETNTGEEIPLNTFPIMEGYIFGIQYYFPDSKLAGNINIVGPTIVGNSMEMLSNSVQNKSGIIEFRYQMNREDIVERFEYKFYDEKNQEIYKAYVDYYFDNEMEITDRNVEVFRSYFYEYVTYNSKDNPLARKEILLSFWNDYKERVKDDNYIYPFSSIISIYDYGEEITSANVDDAIEELSSLLYDNKEQIEYMEKDDRRYAVSNILKTLEQYSMYTTSLDAEKIKERWEEYQEEEEVTVEEFWYYIDPLPKIE